MTEETAPAEGNGITVESSTHPVQETPEPKPVEEEVEADDAGDEADSQEPEEPETDDSSKGKKSRWQRSKEKQAALEAEIQALKAQVYKPQEKPVIQEQKPADNGPKETDYENVLDFVVAKAEWAAEQKANNTLQARDSQRSEQLMVDTFNSKIEALVDEHPDLPQRLQEIVQSGIVTPAMEKQIIASPVGDQITLHLSNNAQDLKILRQMYDMNGEVGLATGLGIIQGKLNNQPQAAVRTSNAPPPITPVNNRSNTKVKPEIEQVASSFEAYQKWKHSK